MHAPERPTMTSLVRDVSHRRQGPRHLGDVVERHRCPSRNLCDEGREHQTAEAVEDVDMGWDVLGADIVEDLTNR